MKKIVKLTESDLEQIVKRVIKESEDETPYEKGPRGIRSSRSRADYESTPKEDEIATLFGKYSDDVPPIVIRYLRKLGRKTLTKRLLDLNMLDTTMLKDEE
jgi:hypothetical protein